MLYLIGLGLSEHGLSLDAVRSIEKCDKVYLENYTVDFPYDITDLGIDESIINLARGDVESDKLINEAKQENVALLVYGAPLFATTHITLLMDARKANVKTRIVQAASVFDAIGETGLQLYKFGKISSMPTWDKGYNPDFMEYVKQNKSIEAHTLLLVDIGLPIDKAIEQLDKCAKDKNVELDKIVLCRKLGTKKSTIFYGTLDQLKKQKVKSPFCFVVPGELHFMEQEALTSFEVKE
ncbi:diphthine synthase [Candidatus Pacearchaeota archaeon]|nr:diphthine synthase [Candidatus Pacearchaeota archaeon]